MDDIFAERARQIFKRRRIELNVSQKSISDRFQQPKAYYTKIELGDLGMPLDIFILCCKFLYLDPVKVIGQIHQLTKQEEFAIKLTNRTVADKARLKMMMEG